MKYLMIEENPIHMYQIFKYEKYEIPLQEILLVKNHKRERLTYALYNEEETIYLLTNVSVQNGKVSGLGGYGRPYCKIEEIGNHSLDTLDSDAYNWYMTHAK